MSKWIGDAWPAWETFAKDMNSVILKGRLWSKSAPPDPLGKRWPCTFMFSHSVLPVFVACMHVVRIHMCLLHSCCASAYVLAMVSMHFNHVVGTWGEVHCRWESRSAPARTKAKGMELLHQEVGQCQHLQRGVLQL